MILIYTFLHSAPVPPLSPFTPQMISWIKAQKEFRQKTTQWQYLWKYLSFAFSALTLLVGRQERHSACKKTWVAGYCLEWDADLHIAQLMPLPLTLASVKSRLVLPFWYWLTWVVPDRGPLNGCVYKCSICEISIWCNFQCTMLC